MPVIARAGLVLGFVLGGASFSQALPLVAPAVPVGTEPPAAAEPAIVEVPQNPHRSRWYGRASLGFAYRWAFDQSMLGAALDGELGAHNQRLVGGVRLHLEAGQLLAGLPYQVVTFGPMMWVKLYDRIHVGAGIDAGALVLSRRTVPGRSMWTVMLGGHVGGTVDLWRRGPSSALILDTSVGAYALTLAPGPVSMLTTLSVGYRP